MKDGFIKVAVAAVEVTVADTTANGKRIIALIEEAIEQDVRLLVLPELATTGLSCGDLFYQHQLQQDALATVSAILKASEASDLLIVVGSAMINCGALYNCAVVIQQGKLLGVIPKEHLISPCGVDQRRWFVGPKVPSIQTELLGQKTWFGTNLLFRCTSMDNFIIGCEVGVDLYDVDSPSRRLAVGGATIIANPAVINELIGSREYQRLLVTGQSAKLSCAYLYSGGGEGESTTDFVYTPHLLIGENGRILAEENDISGSLITTEIDVQRLALERRRRQITTCDQAFTTIPFTMEVRHTPLTRTFNPHPFIPPEADRSTRFERILTVQSYALRKRLSHIGLDSVILGLSGGLDSTLALLSCVRTFDLMGLDRKKIRAISMPGFGTTGRTKSNAEELAALLGVGFQTIPIEEAVKQHFKDIDHDPAVHDVTYENSQARERTQILMDLANKHGALVIGTGDLSELALGWATYNGDHMSMYALNASIAKTLCRHLVRYEAHRSKDPQLAKVLNDIVETPVSPELLPAAEGKIAQKTEDILGPYEVHDFFLYYILRWNFSPEKVLRLTEHTLGSIYSREDLTVWLRTFYRRFFAHQFKRSCLPDGPKIGSVSLSPRSSFSMPSDASARLWLNELE
ncbi:MAG: NAD(+) synthase [Spirochaetales bacterium]|jgi:NAD+ synthase (glutamine-hydrolysing)|nr:NAD(+) synthase [Spirochaetales bacterium]